MFAFVDFSGSLALGKFTVLGTPRQASRENVLRDFATLLGTSVNNSALVFEIVFIVVQT